MTEFRIGAATDVGQVRQNNQDSILATEEQGLFAVADGMGGHRGGEVASAVAITTLQAQFTEPSIDALVEAVQAANDAVVTQAEGNSELRGMGTTLCVLCRITTPDEYLAIANVGDSRLYLLRAQPEIFDGDTNPDAGVGRSVIDDGKVTLPVPMLPELEQVTEDHSLVATLVRQGQITKEEAEVHPHKNILTRALGIDARVMIDSWVLVPVKGDRYLICSDGLFNEVSETEIADVLRTLEPQAAADRLVDMANAGGGRDNISVVIVEVTDDSGRIEGFDPSQPRVAREIHGSERAANDREIVDAVAGSAVAPGGADPAGNGSASPADEVGPDGWTDGTTGADGATGADAGDNPADVVTELGTGAAAPMPVAPGASPPPLPPVQGGGPIAGGPMAPPPSAQVVAAGPSKVTWRVAVFGLAFVVVLGAIGGALLFAANNTYYVGLEGEKVAIFKGRPGGVLWMKPSVVEATSLTRADLPSTFQEDVAKGRDEPTLDEARQYIKNIIDAIAQQAEANKPPPTSAPPTASTSTTFRTGGTSRDVIIDPNPADSSTTTTEG